MRLCRSRTTTSTVGTEKYAAVREHVTERFGERTAVGRS
jgi:hypothetical protein